MLTIRENNFRNEEQYITIDSLVPKNHLVRKIENAINFEFIYDEVKDLYSPLGAPSIDPVVLIKIVLIQYLFGIPSMRQTIKDIEVNVAYRWFLGYSLTEKIPHFSTFNKNYERRFKDTDLFEVIFKKILAQATLNGFIDSSNILELFNYKLDYVIDCCDTVSTKILLIKECLERKIKIISSMGTGNKFHPELLEITELKKTSYDPLAKVIRNKFKHEKRKIMVVCSKEKGISIGDRTPGSTSLVPNAAGILCASFVINDILKEG